jgi:bisphosphoglycerate-dependent phosphoglycerate mutase
MAIYRVFQERTAVRLGREQVMKWRRSFEPSPLESAGASALRHYRNNCDPRYRNAERDSHWESRGGLPEAWW